MVYVDSTEAKHRGMTMCHMIADTDDELHAMADLIGVARRWFQGNHYDIAKSKRALAVKAGAREITWMQAGCMIQRKKITGRCGDPDDAVAWYRLHRHAKAAEKQLGLTDSGREKG